MCVSCVPFAINLSLFRTLTFNLPLTLSFTNSPTSIKDSIGRSRPCVVFFEGLEDALSILLASDPQSARGSSTVNLGAGSGGNPNRYALI